MKTSLLVIFFFFSISSNYSQLSFCQLEKAEDHLLEINAQWQNYSDYLPNERIKFTSNEQRITYHLNLVIAYLRNHVPEGVKGKELGRRNSLLNQLQEYANRGKYPKNTRYPYRRPCFIDQEDTHCAVGLLMQASGNEELAQLVKSKYNDDYIEDIPLKEVEDWAKNFGFSMNELKWIQPGYPPTQSYEVIDGGVNGAVTKLDKWGDKLLVVGEFDSLNSLPCLHLGIYSEGNLSCLGTGLDGVVNDGYLTGNTVIAAGQFNVGETNHSLAFFQIDTEEWTFLDIPNRPNAVVKKIRFNGGNTNFVIIEHPTNSQMQELWLYDNYDWELKATVLGEVNVLSFFGYNKIFLGGDFDTLTYENGTSEGEILSCANNAQFTYGTPINPQEIWETIPGDFGLSVQTMRKIGAVYYIGHQCSSLIGESNVLLSKYYNNTLDHLLTLNQMEDNTDQHVINSIVYNDADALVLGGDFPVNTMMIYGQNLAMFSPITYSMTPIAVLDSSVTAIEYMDGEMIIAGRFTTNNGSQALPYLAKLSDPTNVYNLSIEDLTVTPNPFVDKISIKDLPHNVDYTLYNSSGRKVMTGSTSYEITGLGKLAAGVYFLQLDMEKPVNVKLIKKQN